DFHSIDWEKFNEVLAFRLLLHSLARHITSQEEFDIKVTALTSLIQETITDKKLVPTKKPCPFTKRWWNGDLKALKTDLRKANCEAARYCDIIGHSSKDVLHAIANKMARVIKKAKSEH
ncbi:hypothetical protein C0991_011816, partial [Blastosporella zonata]